MPRIIVELTTREREVIERYVWQRKLPWGLFWRQVIRLAARKAQWIRRRACRTHPLMRNKNETRRQKSPAR